MTLGLRIDYSSLFQTPLLPKIVGRPTFDKLRSLKKYLRQNAASVRSDLGGGAHGHLGLILNDAAYLALTGHQYIRPPHPGALNIPHGTAHHEAVRLREEHHINIQLFRETIDVENALRNQLIASIEPDYIKELENRDTSTIIMPLPDILEFLFRRYGLVDSKRLQQTEDKVTAFAWNVSDAPVVLFNLIEDLQVTAEAAGDPKTAAQLIRYGTNIIQTTGEFEMGLLAWYARPPAEHTWDNFKTHFINEYNNLIKVRGANMRGSSFHHANATVAAVTAEMRRFGDELINNINSHPVPQNDAPPPFFLPPPPVLQEMNALNSTTSNQDLLTALTTLIASMRVNIAKKTNTASTRMVAIPTTWFADVIATS